MSIVDKLTPLPPLPESYDKDGHALPDERKPKAPLTADELALLARSSTFIQSAMQRHGITLTSKEIPFLGAEVADFVESVMEEEFSGFQNHTDTVLKVRDEKIAELEAKLKAQPPAPSTAGAGITPPPEGAS